MKEPLPIPQHLVGKLWFSEKPRLDRFHRHDELECNLVVSGKGAYLLNGRRVPLQKNSILWLFPEQEHLMLDQSDDFQIWVLVIKPQSLQLLCTDADTKPLLERNPSGSFVRHLNQSQITKLIALCEDIVQAIERPALFNVGLGYLFLSAWAAFQTASIMPLPNSVHPVVERIAKIIHAGQSADDLKSIANLVNMTPQTVSRLFKKQTGISLTEFRNRCRINRFLELYGHGHTHTMLECALQAGFGSYAQFYRVFVQIMNMTPAHYRKCLSDSH